MVFALVAVATMVECASASASTLSLSASPTTDSSGFPAATIKATGTADAGDLSELDVFAVPSTSTCAADSWKRPKSWPLTGLHAEFVRELVAGAR
jgi:hypothetical protein